MVIIRTPYRFKTFSVVLSLLSYYPCKIILSDRRSNLEVKNVQLKSVTDIESLYSCNSNPSNVISCRNSIWNIIISFLLITRGQSSKNCIRVKPKANRSKGWNFHESGRLSKWTIVRKWSVSLKVEFLWQNQTVICMNENSRSWLITSFSFNYAQFRPFEPFLTVMEYKQ